MHVPRRVIFVVIKIRPPTDSYVLEFPAGLIDAGESPEKAALRELHEETGYQGTARSVSTVMVNDPGMSDANMVLVTVDVDLTLQNKEIKPKLEAGEFIETFVVPLENLLDTFERLKAEGGKVGKKVTVDARLWHVAYGMEFNKSLFSS
jgi:ADP-ribose pyrophosphatase